MRGITPYVGPSSEGSTFAVSSISPCVSRRTSGIIARSLPRPSDGRDCLATRRSMEMSQVAESVTSTQRSAAASGLLADRAGLKRTFDDQGYLIFRNVVPADKLADLHRRLK